MDNTKDKNQFKPHLVEIQDRPVSPLGRKILWSILIFMGLTVLWLFLSKTDVVVSARAKVIRQGGDIKILQTLSTGSVKKIYIKEGDFVKKDDPLIEIDPSVEGTNIEAKKLTLTLLELEILKLKSLINNVPFIVPSEIPNDMSQMVKNQYIVELNTFQEQKEQIDQQINQLEEEISIQRIDKNRLSQMYQIGIEEQRKMEQVLDIIAKNDYYQHKKQNISTQKEISKVSHKIFQLKEQMQELKMKKSLLENNYKNQCYNDLKEKEKEIISLGAEIDMIEYKKQKQIITSPVYGIVGKIAVNNIGAVVTPAEKLITIVPKNMPLYLKANVENKDIGFIKVGMPVAIKIDAFNFQRYGLIDGNVTKIAPNAIEDQKLGLVYEVFIEPKQKFLRVEGEDRYILPGMSATVEMKVGNRRIIELFIYPLIKYFNEGISVR